MSVRNLRAKTGVWWTAALLAVGATGCASSGQGPAVAAGCGHSESGVALARIRPSGDLTYPWTWGAGRGSVVSPLGDAPGERDLDTAGNWGLKPQNYCTICASVHPTKGVAGVK